jgi:hypothetical protein
MAGIKAGKAVGSAVGKAVATVGSGAKSVARKASDKAGTVVRETSGPSPNPMTNLVIADIALRGGAQLLRHAVERTVLGAKYSPEKAKDIVKGRSMAQTLIGTALARVATRSVPGAIVIGGGLLAKTLYDRSRARAAAAEGTIAVEEQVEDGRKAG